MSSRRSSGVPEQPFRKLSLRGWGGGWGGYHRHFGGGFGIGYAGGGYGDDGCYVVRRVPTPFGYRLRTINVCEY
jgi:hypothetical protein